MVFCRNCGLAWFAACPAVEGDLVRSIYTFPASKAGTSIGHCTCERCTTKPKTDVSLIVAQGTLFINTLGGVCKVPTSNP